MLQEEAHIGATVAMVVVAVVMVLYAHSLSLVERAAQVRGQYVLMAQLTAKGRSSEHPLAVAAEGSSQDIVAMEVLAGLSVLDELEVVEIAGKGKRGGEMYVAGCGIALEGCHIARALLPLVGKLGAIEGVGAIALLVVANLPVEEHIVSCVAPLIEESDAVEIAVLHGTVGAQIVARQTVAPQDCAAGFTTGDIRIGTTAEGAVAAAFCMNANLRGRLCASNNIDYAIESLAAKRASRCSVKNFYALDVCNGYREISCKMTGLGIVDVDAVEHKSDLVECAAAEGYVGLHSHGAALSDINIRTKLKDVVDGLTFGIVNLLSCNHDNLAPRLV